ncbi:hypothetical protein FEM03_23990 [Phragmitibacter flavus]|uniref:Uncharacterized protein n=1 Tax=Phragmitibacter flavus TaxID=2576071 RepID=A0A5R8K734_9BACT|nr:hypothetical protein [Phragmitibacter flavus]TLD68178.1 hypothetical protein FEM03_23990 [Phragmitibacter flavus]
MANSSIIRSLSLLADANRVRILALLREEELSVGDDGWQRGELGMLRLSIPIFLRASGYVVEASPPRPKHLE